MVQDAGQRSWKSEAVGEHVLLAGYAELAAEEIIPVQYLADDGFGVRRVHVAFLHRGACRKPTTCSYILLQSLEVRGEVLLHEPVAVGSGEIEDIVRVLIE